MFGKESVRVTVTGKQVRAILYIMNRGEEHAPSKMYYNTILGGTAAGADCERWRLKLAAPLTLPDIIGHKNTLVAQGKERIVASFRLVVQMAGHYLNHLKVALKHRTALLNTDITGKIEKIKTKNEDYPYGPDVKMVRQHKITLKLLTPEEKDEAVKKYQEGLSMAAVADIYGCHYTTVGRLLRERGVEIRGKG